MSTYQSLLQQKAELEAQMADAQKREKFAAVTQARELVKQHGLTADDVFDKYNSAGIRNTGSKRRTVAPKYSDPATGATWTGRGREPTWIKGKDRAAFAI